MLTVTLNPAIDLHLAIAQWPRGDLARAVGASRSAGGKGINVSRVLAALGVGSEAFCLVGQGPDGAVFRGLLEDAPFAVHAFEIPGTVRTNVTVACVRDGRSLKVNQAGPLLSAAAWGRVERALDGLMAGRAWVVLSGALPPGAAVDGYARLVRRAHRRGARVALDCAGESLLAALPERPDLLKPNREELAATLGLPCRTRRAAVAAARELQRRGAGWVIVSGGAGECLGLTPEDAWRALPPKIATAGPMGAGDSLLAGFLAGVMRGKRFAEALRQGVAAGAATAALPNTEFCRRTQLAVLLKRISVEHAE